MRTSLLLFVILLNVACAQLLMAQRTSDILKPDFGFNLGTCPICGMDVFEKMLTRVDLVREDTTVHACALGCASEMIRQSQYDKIFVCEFDSMRMVPAMEAYFIFGSRLVPARSMIASLSFISKENAEHFQKLYGGTMYFGNDAFEAAAAIRQERMSEKKKEAEKKH